MSNNEKLLVTLKELDRFRPYVNLAELARVTGQHRANIKRWWDNGDDLLATPKRREFRTQMLEIMKESRSELGRLFRGESEPPQDYEYLLGDED